MVIFVRVVGASCVLAGLYFQSFHNFNHIYTNSTWKMHPNPLNYSSHSLSCCISMSTNTATNENARKWPGVQFQIRKMFATKICYDIFFRGESYVTEKLCLVHILSLKHFSFLSSTFASSCRSKLWIWIE